MTTSNIGSQLPVPEDSSSHGVEKNKDSTNKSELTHEQLETVKGALKRNGEAQAPTPKKREFKPTKQVSAGIRERQEQLYSSTKKKETPHQAPGKENVLERKKEYLNKAAEEKPVKKMKADVAEGVVEDSKAQLDLASKGKPLARTEIEVDKGLVESKKGALGLKMPTHRLGAGVHVSSEAVARHRNPKDAAGYQAYRQHALSEKHMEGKLKELTDAFKLDKGRDPDLAELAKLKEQAAQWAYDTHMQSNIARGHYNPAAIATEIKMVLDVGDEIPAGIVDQKSAMQAIHDELDTFNIPVFAEGRKQKQVLTNELRVHLENDIAKTMEQYKKVYPDKSWEEVFVFCRDMSRAAVYQVIFDKTSFTGSDHGVLHIHHNSENGDHMHEQMDEGDMSDRAKLLSRIMHFYHDIGYSVGETSFEAKKDHPFIGAAFIEENRSYFEHYLGADGADILKKSILYHAIVSFDSTVGDDLAMVRFTTSNSDACAVTADQKTQSFWREHPETLLSLAKLRQFLLIYPEYGSRSKLSSMDIINNPAKVFKLKVEQEPPDLSESNFVNPHDYKAWKVFSTVRKELMDIAQQQKLPEEEKRAFLEAIASNFNAFSGDIVLAQYGAELREVSVAKNTDVSGPKYKPSVEMSPSTLFLFLQSAFDGVAGENLRKVLNKEYGAKLEDIDPRLDQVGRGEEDRVVVPSAFAHLVISKQTEAPSKKFKPVLETLAQFESIHVPHETRREVNKVVAVLNDMKSGKKRLNDFTDAVGTLFSVVDPTSELGAGLNQLLGETGAKLSRSSALSQDDYDEMILAIRTQCATPEELEALDRNV